MIWYQGEISEAIQKAISEKKLFVVFVRGEDEESKEMSTFWELEEVKSLCTDEVCVAINITVDSVAGQQFGSIYPILCVPSTFLINNDGIPSAILPKMEQEEFIAKLREVIQSSKTNEPSQQQEEKNTSAPSPKVENTIESSSTEEEEILGASGEQTAELSKKEKAEMLKEKARVFKEKKEKEEQKERERKRREEGRELSQAKRDLAERQAKALADDIAKRRQEEKAAKERVRQQIKQDREDKLAKFEAEKKAREKLRQENVEAKKAAATTTKNEKANSNITRIQFRLPDGSTASQQFSSDAKFHDVNNFVRTEIAAHMPYVRLTTVYPKHEYTSDDDSKSLRELGLTPNASIIVSPGKGKKSSSALNPFSIIMMILTPVIAIISWFFSLFSSSKNSSNEPTDTKETKEESNTQSPNNPRNASVRRRNLDQPKSGSNIRRLYDDKPDDDDNATWNGNSTQQM